MLLSLIRRLLRASLVQIDTEMAEKYTNQRAVRDKFALEDMPQDVCQH